MSRVIVGVDAGGSRTIAAAARGDETPRTFEVEGANPHVCGIDAAVSAIARAVTGAVAGRRAGRDRGRQRGCRSRGNGASDNARIARVFS